MLDCALRRSACPGRRLVLSPVWSTSSTSICAPVPVGSACAISLAPCPEIGFDHLRIALHFRRRSFGDLHAVIEHGNLVGDAHHDLHVVLDQQDRQIEILAHPVDEPGHLRRLVRVHAGRRFIQQQQLRLAGQRPRDLQAPLIAIGEILRRHVALARAARRTPAIPALVARDSRSSRLTEAAGGPRRAAST